jgi:hypothetical protein
MNLLPLLDQRPLDREGTRKAIEICRAILGVLPEEEDPLVHKCTQGLVGGLLANDDAETCAIAKLELVKDYTLLSGDNSASQNMERAIAHGQNCGRVLHPRRVAPPLGQSTTVSLQCLLSAHCW